MYYFKATKNIVWKFYTVETSKTKADYSNFAKWKFIFFSLALLESVFLIRFS